MNPPLSPSGVVAYLLQKDLISPSSVCDGDVLVTDVSRRNCNVRVVRERGPSYLVKQCAEPNAVETLANEGAVYRLLHRDRRYRSLTKFLPRFYGYDPEKNVLILELLADDAPDLEHYHARGHMSQTIGRAMARGLAALHRAGADNALERPTRVPTVDELPWAFSIHRPSLGQLRQLSGASSQVVGILQRYPDFGELIDQSAAQWHASGLIHGDVKWANFIACSPAGSRRRTRLKIVDWEYAGVGDPCWDIGSAFSAYISFWVLAMPLVSTDGSTPGEKLSRFRLEPMQQAMRAFWSTYASTMNLDPRERQALLWRSTLFSAVRLVQTAIERTQTATLLNNNVVYLLQLAMNVLRQPVDAVVHLLGIDLRAETSHV